MKIYTKKGDKGTTSLYGRGKVLKSDIRINAYGTIDELNSWIGLVKDNIKMMNLEQELLLKIQENLFTIGAYLATPDPKFKKQLPPLSQTISTEMEQSIDRMQSTLPPMKNFILPGGHPWVSQCHIARCVCRRAEREVVLLHQSEPLEAEILIFLNRLSDYLFVLSRTIGHFLQVEEIYWKTGK